MLTVFYVLAALLIVQGLISLWEGFRYRAFVLATLADQPPNYQPAVTIIAPCKGLDVGFHENIAALLKQDYPAYEITFVVESATDPAFAALTNLLDDPDQHPTLTEPAEAVQCPPTQIIIAGRSTSTGQKIHNLLTALEAASNQSEVFVFVDSDAHPHRDWLRYLVAPLAAEEIGATTGYRWYLPLKQNLAGALLSVWNGAIATTLGAHRRNFAWGGSMAITRQNFAALGIRAAWQGAVSDDYALTRAVKRAGKYIKYVPQCLIVSYEQLNWRQLLEFTTRQIIITRVYSPDLWRLAWVTHILFNTTFYLGLVLIIWRLLLGQSILLPALLIGLIYLLGAWKGWLRYRSVSLLLGPYRRELRRLAWAYVLLPPFTSLLWLYNLIASARTQRITWRGISYELRSPSETIILGP